MDEATLIEFSKVAGLSIIKEGDRYAIRYTNDPGMRPLYLRNPADVQMLVTAELAAVAQ